MARFILDAIVTARRARDAIRQIKQLPIGERDKKYILGAWFDEHTQARGDKASRYNAYNELLGRARNARLMG